MKLDDIANLLAEKINQAHYIKHYLNNVFINGFQKGAENSEKFAIGFTEWITINAYKESVWRMYDKKDAEFTTQELFQIYKKQLE